MEYIRVRFDPNDIRDVIASGNVMSGQTGTAKGSPNIP